MEPSIKPETGLDLKPAQMSIDVEPEVPMNSKEFYEFISTGQSLSHANSIGFDELPVKEFTTPMNRGYEDMSPDQRMQHIQQYWREGDKKVCQSLQEKSAGGPTMSQYDWERSRGLKPVTNRDMRVPFDWQSLVDSDEVSPTDVAWAFGRLYDKSLVSDKGYLSSVLWQGVDDEDFALYEKPAKQKWLSYNDVDVECMSWPEQREFRYNHPDAYASWVDALKTEMGIWYDASLVLPEYLSPLPPQIKVSGVAGFFKLWDEIHEALQRGTKTWLPSTEKDLAKLDTLMNPETWADMDGVY